MNVTVYLGSSEGKRPSYRQAARQLGEWIGSSGHTLVYGGSRMGLMGVLADAVIASGGRVVGVEPRFFVEAEVQHSNITELIVTETMADRKSKMIELGDVFIAFPGGIGTLEEITEVMTLVKLGKLDKTFCFLSIDGYYEPLRKYLLHMADEGFVDRKWAEKVYFAENISDMAKYIGTDR